MAGLKGGLRGGENFWGSGREKSKGVGGRPAFPFAFRPSPSLLREVLIYAEKSKVENRKSKGVGAAPLFLSRFALRLSPCLLFFGKF